MNNGKANQKMSKILAAVISIVLFGILSIGFGYLLAVALTGV